MTFKEFWIANRMSYLISTVISILGAMFINLIIQSSRGLPLNIMANFLWSLIVIPVLVFILMCLMEFIISKKEEEK